MVVRQLTRADCAHPGSPAAALAPAPAPEGTGRRRSLRRAMIWLAASGLGVVSLSASGAAAEVVPAGRAAGCMAGPVACYGLVATDTAAVEQDLTPQYEVGLQNTIYGPETGLPVPWAQVAAWITAHPAIATAGTDVEQGFHLTDLAVLGGHAYMLFSPDGHMAKLYLTASPMQWD